MAAAMVIPAIASLAGGIMGGRAAQQAQDRANAITNDLLKRYQNLQLPDTEQMKLALEQYQSQGVLDPQLEAALQLGPTAYEQISLNPEYQQAMEQALQDMSGMSKTGLNEIDRAALEDILRKSSADAQSSREAVLANRAARGMAGSGDELAAALAGSQAASNQANDEAMKVAAMSAQRRMDATNQAAGLAQALQQSQYQKQSDLAGKRDVIEQFNKQLAQGTQQRNVDRSNQSQSANLAAAQNIAGANVDVRNRQQQHNTQLGQQQFQNELSRLGGMSGTVNQAAANLTQQGANQGAMWAGVGSGLGQVLSNVNFGGKKPDAAGGVTNYSTDYLNKKG